MKPYVELKFADDIDAETVRKLVHRFGFQYSSRNYGNWVIYRKYYRTIDDKTTKYLIAECNSLCEPFYGVDGVAKEDVSDAIKTFAKSKRDPLHRNFILKWAEDNIDNVTNDALPW